MSDQEVTSEEITHLVETVVAFSRMANNTKSFCQTNVNVELAMKCARQVENMYHALGEERLHFLFIKHICRTLQIEEDSYDTSSMQYACDTLVEAILTSDSVLSSRALCCMNNYIKLCGKDRFTHLMSVIIVKSEACRLLLDLIGSLENDSQASIIFQANILLRILTEKYNEAEVIHAIYNWLNSKAERQIYIVFQALSEVGLVSNISEALIRGLVSVLDDRKEAALLYWPTVMSSPVSVSVLKKSNSLFYASLDFLSKCAENFKQTPLFTWSSCETGPCQVITFDMIVIYVQFIKTADESFTTLVDKFLIERCSLPGCTFWEDIINSLPT